MNVQHSIGMPTRWEISAIGRISAMTVRAAQFACTCEPLSGDLAREPLDVRRHLRPAPGSPMFAVSIRADR